MNTWIKITKNFSDFAVGALINNIEIYQLPAGARLISSTIKHSASFTGGAILSYTLSIGIVGNLIKYTPVFNVFQAPSNTAFSDNSNFNIENWGTTTSIRASAISVGGILNTATNGSVDIFLEISQIKF